MPFTLTIDTGNAAFADDPAGEIPRILAHVASYIGATYGINPGDSGSVLDVNGNSCGSWSYTPEEADDVAAGHLFGDETDCFNCADRIHLDSNGAGGLVWVHNFGSTVCGDDPPGSIVGTFTATPVR